MQLFEHEWLDDEIVNLYAELLVRDDPRFQVISSLKIAWELDVLDRQGGTTDSFASFDLEPHTTSFLIPTFVNGNHWMLCVAKFLTREAGRGPLIGTTHCRILHFSHCEGIGRAMLSGS